MKENKEDADSFGVARQCAAGPGEAEGRTRSAMKTTAFGPNVTYRWQELPIADKEEQL